jgi:hypothetical protein
VTDRGCPGHAPLADELRGYLTRALDVLEPLVDRMREQTRADPPGAATACAACPVCALIALLRGERSELAARFAEQAVGVIAVLRAALAEGVGAPSANPSAGPEPPPARPEAASARPEAASARPEAASARVATRPQPAPARAEPAATRPEPASPVTFPPVTSGGFAGSRSSARRAERAVQRIPITRDGRPSRRPPGPSREPC